jgi:hypothetical protein
METTHELLQTKFDTMNDTGHTYKFYLNHYSRSGLSSGIYCHVKWLSTDISEVRTASIIRDEWA